MSEKKAMFCSEKKDPDSTVFSVGKIHVYSLNLGPLKS